MAVDNGQGHDEDTHEVYVGNDVHGEIGYRHDGGHHGHDAKIREICSLSHPVRLVITLGYAKEGDKLRTKKRKDMDELVTKL